MELNTSRLLQIAQRSLSAGEQESELEQEAPAKIQTTPEAPKLDYTRLHAIAAQDRTGSFRPQTPDIGVVGAFGSGVKTGILDPLNLVLGKPEVDERIDSGPEKTAKFLGDMVGLGISFVPFAVTTGIALRGFGLTKALAPDILRAIQYTSAGGLQFAGSSENLSEVPKNFALGIAFGGGIEAAFLARSMMGRAGKSADELVDAMRGEIELSPTQGKTAERTIDELRAIPREDLTNEQILADLTENHLEAISIGGLNPTKIEGLRSYISSKMPSATVLDRPVVKGTSHEVLIHNPVDPSEVLTQAQKEMWQGHGFFTNQEAIYKGSAYRVLGPTAEGRIQLQNIQRPGLVFAARLSEVNLPTSPKVFTPGNVRRQNLLDSALESTKKRIGFAISTPAGRVSRGSVDVSSFATASSFDDYIRTNFDKIKNIQGESLEASALEYARREGHKGLLIQESGITTEVRIWDQTSVSRLKEPPRAPGFGVEMDKHALYLNPDGSSILESFVPGWKNTIGVALRENGVPQKEINELLEVYANSMGKRLDDLMDPEFKTMKEAAEAQFLGGCQ